MATVVAALIAVPIIVVFANLLVPSGDVWRHLIATVLGRYAANTLVVVVGVGAGTLVVGTATAWLVTMCRFPGRAVLEWALVLPLAVPAYAIAFTYGHLFDFAGPLQTFLRESFGWSRGDYWFPQMRSLGGAVLVLTAVLYPYVYLLARAAFLEQSVCVLEASRMLGRGPWRSFFGIALPLARPALAAGVILALMEALSDFGAVQHLAVDTFTTGIYRTWFGLGNPAAAGQLAALLMSVVLLLIGAERLLRGGARYHHTSSRYRRIAGHLLRGRRAAAASVVCWVPVAIGFLFPGVQLLLWAAESGGRLLEDGFLGLAATSITLAGATAALVVTVALVLAYARRIQPRILTLVATRLAGLGYAAPGSVLAVGILIPFAWIDTTLDHWARARFGISTGLLLSGTTAALFAAYLVRFLAVALNPVEAGLAKITPSMDGAARSLGLGPAQAIRRVHAPLLSGTLLAAAILVFVDVMKELPATMILRPFNLNTLAVRAFELAADEQLAAAAAPALAIVVAGLAPVVMLIRAMRRARPGSAADAP
ncbi:MAG: iron ABC transporter permease [Alphaproteobacteria bacterium]|nr:iron ABC transporter permease [Alphaproteobacteria bacterium]